MVRLWQQALTGLAAGMQRFRTAPDAEQAEVGPLIVRLPTGRHASQSNISSCHRPAADLVRIDRRNGSRLVAAICSKLAALFGGLSICCHAHRSLQLPGLVWCGLRAPGARRGAPSVNLI